MSVCFISPYTPLIYSKTGVYRGIHYFLIFDLKHILCLLNEWGGGCGGGYTSSTRQRGVSIMGEFMSTIQ